MRVACPGCAAVYEPPARLLKPGLRLRCAVCGESWVLDDDAAPEAAAPSHEGPADAPAERPAGPPASPSASEPGPPGAPPAELTLREESSAAIAARRMALASGIAPSGRERLQPVFEPAPPERSPRGVAAGWLLTCAVIAALAWGAYAYRGRVMAAWPPSTRVYAGLGLMK